MTAALCDKPAGCMEFWPAPPNASRPGDRIFVRCVNTRCTQHGKRYWHEWPQVRQQPQVIQMHTRSAPPSRAPDHVNGIDIELPGPGEAGFQPPVSDTIS